MSFNLQKSIEINDTLALQAYLSGGASACACLVGDNNSPPRSLLALALTHQSWEVCAILLDAGAHPLENGAHEEYVRLKLKIVDDAFNTTLVKGFSKENPPVKTLLHMLRAARAQGVENVLHSMAVTPVLPNSSLPYAMLMATRDTGVPILQVLPNNWVPLYQELDEFIQSAVQAEIIASALPPSVSVRNSKI